MVFRSFYFFLVMLPYLIVAIPLQVVIATLGLPGWHILPRIFHSLGALFLGMRVTVVGRPNQAGPTLLVCNHISWTDIIAIGAKTNVSFVAKSEIQRWPFVGFMASLQKTIYVNRNKRSDAGRTSREMAQRMASGGAVVLFAEGQSDNGTHVLPFRSALIGSAQSAMRGAGAGEVYIQPMTIAYTKIQNLPISLNERSLLRWAKERGFWGNVVAILGSGVKDITIAFGTPMRFEEGADRKELTKKAETQVRRMLVALNRRQPLPTQDAA
jgi:1-acyl-sn-glycerol-3-phosphate acyltransferase